MSRTDQLRLVDLHPRDCLDLPHDCVAGTCEGPCVACAPGQDRRSRLMDQPWLTAAQDAWGLCGVAALRGEDVRGYVLVSPAVNVPVRGPYARSGASVDAAAIMRWCVDGGPLAEDGDVARRLLEHLAAQCARHRLDALEACAATNRPTCNRPSAAWLADHGFRPIREGPVAVTMRLELRSTRSWRDAWTAVGSRARQWLSAPTPAPAPGLPPAGRRLAR